MRKIMVLFVLAMTLTIVGCSNELDEGAEGLTDTFDETNVDPLHTSPQNPVSVESVHRDNEDLEGGDEVEINVGVFNSEQDEQTVSISIECLEEELNYESSETVIGSRESGLLTVEIELPENVEICSFRALDEDGEVISAVQAEI